MAITTVSGQSIQRIFTTAGTYTVTLTVTSGALSGTSSPITITATPAVTSLGLRGSWSRTGIYRLACAMMGMESFSSISEFDTDTKAIMDSQWGDFLAIFVDKWRLEDFLREEDLNTALDTTTFDSVEDVEGFSYFYELPPDGVRPHEVEGIEWIKGASRGRWQWKLLTYTSGGVKRVRRVIMHNKNASTSDPLHVAFYFVPQTPANHDSPFDHYIQPATCQFMAAQFALHCAPMMGLDPGKREELRRMSNEYQTRTQAIEAQTGSRRRRKSGDVVGARRSTGRRGGRYG